MSTKVVINVSIGGFNLSQLAAESLGLKWNDKYNIPEKDSAYYERFPLGGRMGRDDAALVKCVEEMGQAAAETCFCKLKIVEIPDDVEDWYIYHASDGTEAVHETHRCWE